MPTEAPHRPRVDVVLGENIDPAATADPGRGDITIINRFLVSATSTGTLTCTLYRGRRGQRLQADPRPDHRRGPHEGRGHRGRGVHVLPPVTCEHSSTTSNARFTLYAHQMSGNDICASAPQAQTSVSVSRQTHHKAIPLYTTITLAPGCDRIYAYVRAEHVGGPTGAIQGQANGLTDGTGSTGTHDSV